MNTENCIPEELLPPRAGLIAIRMNNPYYKMSDDEIRDRLEFIRCYLFRDFELLLLIPKNDNKDEFAFHDVTATDSEYSAFNSADFKRPAFDKYGYAMGKIMEHIQNLAILHSSINSSDGRDEIEKRYENFLDLKFRDRLAVLIVQLQNCRDYDRRSTLEQKIAELNRRILEARRIWARYAPPEYWDR
ncbi:hypothetical protein [Desulfosarcina variabilis]|uniref:hypothetical protein n=1 Tax=Desulfosarcina variabilis TaxID=2300 RepID=UPI003AFA2038